MKKLLTFKTLFFLSLLLISCGGKKIVTIDDTTNPVYRENLLEIYNVMIKRYEVDFKDLKKLFGEPVKTEIDSTLADLDKETYDSTFTFTYKTIIFHYYKRTYDKKYLFTRVDLGGEFKTKQFVLSLDQTKDEVLSLFGEPTQTKNVGISSEELTYPLSKDDAGAYYDTILLYFTDGKFSGVSYIPYLEIYEKKNQEQQQESY